MTEVEHHTHNDYDHNTEKLDNPQGINHVKIARWVSFILFSACAIIMAIFWPSKDALHSHLSDGLMKTVHRGTISNIIDNCQKNYECVKTVYVTVHGEQRVADSEISTRGLHVGDKVWIHYANGTFTVDRKSVV